ncbi:hypothetical protein F5B20DRAFT_577604 [Whalleya microplaca]|nr:hypothetical protein F5B20DRAFT_577604 [Whalleya microplaca]
MAQEPEEAQIQLDWNQLSQAWTLKSIKCMLHKLDLMEGMMRDIQGAKAAETLEELQKDVESLRKLYHDVEPGVRTTNKSLQVLNDQVNYHYRHLNENIGKAGEKIESVTDTLHRQQKHIDITQESIKATQSSVSAQEEEMKILNDSLIEVTRSVQSLDDKLGSLHKTFEQKSMVASEEKEIIENLVDGQAQFQDSLNRLAPFQERLLQFLEPPLIPNSPVNQNDPRPEKPISNNDATMSKAPTCLGRRSPPAAAKQMLEKYAKFRKSYMAHRPKSEARFIRGYLRKLDSRIAWFIQKELQKDYPDLVEVLETETWSKTGAAIFINVDKLSWQHVKDTMHRTNYKPLYDLLDRDLDGIAKLLPLKRQETDLIPLGSNNCCSQHRRKFMPMSHRVNHGNGSTETDQEEYLYL